MTSIDRVVDKARNGAISRREFARGATALGIAGLVAPSLSRGARADAPRKGGHMRFGVGHGSTTDTLDPAHVANGFLSVMQYTIGSMLTEVDAKNELQPKLAESWEGSPDATIWTFRLRKGVTFHNGRVLKAKDVIAAINHHRGKDSTSGAKPLVDPIVSMDAPDDQTVVIKLSAGNVDFPFILAQFDFPIYPSNDDGTMDWQSHIGAGPYVLKSFEPGVRATFERNPNYFMGDSRAHFDTCELLAILDVSARQDALISGEVDGIDRVDPQTFSLLGQKKGIQVKEMQGKFHYTFPMRTDTAPFTDNNVRLALKYAVDREALLQTVLFGHGQVGNDHPINGTYPNFAGDIEQRHYDPDKAKFYLNKAGVSKVSVKLSAADAAFSRAVDAAVLYQDHAAKVGIDIEVVRVPSDGYWSNTWMQAPWCAAYWFGTATPDGILTQAYSAGASWNDSYWKNDRFNTLLLAARAEQDKAKRKDMYHEMQLLVRDEGGVVVPLFANDLFAITDNVRHGDLATVNEVDGRLFFERWWFAA
jgi:peptide/nickel transport system substrate-binding protein